MSVKLYQETTKWNGDFPNHTYLIDFDVSKDKIIGYIKEGTSKVIMFKKPLRFYKAKRTFKISAFEKLYKWVYY